MVGLSLYDIVTNPLPVFRSFYMLPIGVAVLGFGLLRLLRRELLGRDRARRSWAPPPRRRRARARAVRQTELRLLHRWLDSWRGIGDVVVRMARQGWDLQLTEYDAERWHATFFVAGQAYSIVRLIGVGDDGVAGDAAGGLGHAHEAGGQTMTRGALVVWSLRRFLTRALPALSRSAPDLVAFSPCAIDKNGCPRRTDGWTDVSRRPSGSSRDP
jgi:hypothetical protein